MSRPVAAPDGSSQLLPKLNRLYFQSVNAILGSGNLGHHLGTRRLTGIARAVSPVLERLAGLGVAGLIQRVGFVGNHERERGGGAGRIAGGGALVLFVALGVDQPA